MSVTSEDIPIAGPLGLPVGTIVKGTDVYPAVDVTDLSSSPTGTTKQYTMTQLAAYIAPISINWSTKVQVISATGSGTYTPTTGMIFCVVEIVGAGGGSGGIAGSASQSGVSGAGGGGGYSKKTYSSSEIGLNAAVVIGAAGNGGAAGNHNGTSGGSSSFTPAGVGSILTVLGGSFGSGSSSTAGNFTVSGGTGGSASGGDINISGGAGSQGVVIGGATVDSTIPGIGGGSYFAPSVGNPGNQVGTSGAGYGGGASGSQIGTSGNVTGAPGSNAICYITEYLSTLA